MKGSETRAKIVQSAMQLAAREGLLNITLDRVAEEAGLSKGGVIHHYPSKEALLSGVITYFTEQIDGIMTRLVAEDPSPNYRWARAMLRLYRNVELMPSHEGEAGGEGETSASPEEASPGKEAALESAGPASQLFSAEQGRALNSFMLSLLAVAVHNPDLLKPMHLIGQRMRGRLTAVPEEGVEQILVWLILDGLFLWRFVGIIKEGDPIIEEVLRHLENRIEALSTGWDAAPPPRPSRPRGPSRKAAAKKRPSK